MTLIAVYNSEGLVGRCDAKCYEATGPDCDCVCGGANHGKGRERAVEQTRELAQTWLDAYADRLGLDAYTSEVPVAQLDLFSV